MLGERTDRSSVEGVGTARRQIVHRAECMVMGDRTDRNNGKTEKIFITEFVYKHRQSILILIKVPIEIPWRRWKGTSRLRITELLECLHMKAAKEAALRTDRLYLPEHIPGTQFCYRLSRPQGHNATGRTKSMTPSGLETATFRLVALRLNRAAVCQQTDR